jgi:hypothetical protein
MVFFDRCQISKVAVELIVGVFPNRTGVDDDDVCLCVCGGDVPGGFKGTAESFGVVRTSYVRFCPLLMLAGTVGVTVGVGVSLTLVMIIYFTIG